MANVESKNLYVNLILVNQKNQGKTFLGALLLRSTVGYIFDISIKRRIF
jgi:hypothetical protein